MRLMLHHPLKEEKEELLELKGLGSVPALFVFLCLLVQQLRRKK